MPVHVKNLKGLVSQYENHRNHFEEISDRYNEVTKELENTKKTNKRLDAKNITYQKQIGKLEREKADSGMAINEKDAKIRDMTRQVRTQRNELDKQLGMAERKYKMDTDKAVRHAVGTTEARLKSREAKLAQLKHVLDKTKFDGSGGGNNNNNNEHMSPENGSRPNTRSQNRQKVGGNNNNDRQSPREANREQTNNHKVQSYINKQNLEQNSGENPFNNPLSGNEKVRYLLNHN
jgi:chromosome segregation ATPase